MNVLIIVSVVAVIVVCGLFIRHKWLQPRLVSVPVDMETFIVKMKAPKDIKVFIRSDGGFAAFCKTCEKYHATAQKEGLIWFSCPKCKRVSFNPEANMPRDIQLAKDNGGTFEYEVYYLEDLPPELKPPPFDYAEAERISE